MCAVCALLEFILRAFTGIITFRYGVVYCQDKIHWMLLLQCGCYEQYLFHCRPTHYRYFSLQASEQLGLGDSVRLDVENKICDEHGPCMDSFAVPQKMAYDIMNKVYNPLHTLLS